MNLTNALPNTFEHHNALLCHPDTWFIVTKIHLAQTALQSWQTKDM